MLILVAFILAILLLIAIPAWPHSSGWGYYPSAGIGIVLVIIVVYLILTR